MTFETNNPVETSDVRLCVSLCEVAPPDATPDDLERIVGDTCWQAGFPFCERVYVGSYFCENYFCGLGDGFHGSLRELCARHGMRATLVVPIVGQAFLDRAWRRIDELLDRFGDLYDEVVVNDVAACLDMAQRIASQGEQAKKRIGLGRLFTKNPRDARIGAMMERTARPELSPEALECLQACAAQPVIELDPTAEVVDASGVLAAAPQAEIALHLPFCYATTGRNCGPASIDEPVDRKFLIGRGCSRHCLRMAQGYLTDEGVCYLKHGRTFYFANPGCSIAGTPAWRIVYAASHETMA